MGEAKRRKLQGRGAPNGIKLTPRKRAAGFTLVHHDRVEEQGPDGKVYARNLFAVVDADGHPLAEETPDGPKLILVPTMLQPVRRSILTKA